MFFKNNKYIEHVTMWLSVSAAAVTAIIFTQSAIPLWAFVFPFFVIIHDRSDKQWGRKSVKADKGVDK